MNITSYKFARFALAAAVTCASLLSYGQTVPVTGIVELSGPGATAGTNFDNGVKLAVKAINAAGGMAGKKIEYTSLDTQTQPGVAKALAKRAIDQGGNVFEEHTQGRQRIGDLREQRLRQGRA